MRTVILVLSACLAAGVAACGEADTIETVPTTTTVADLVPSPSDGDTDLTRLARDIRTLQVAAWNRAVWQAELERQAAAAAAEAEEAARRTPAPDDVPSGRCGGTLPPCWVLQRESRGRYDAVNPTGCGGRGCYGGWQFDPRTWDATVRRMGRPDLVGQYLASPDDQDAAAAYLWAGGAGCSHWAAC